MRTPDWQTEDGAIRLYCGDALELLAELPDNSIDAVITDPPYSSGGQFRGDRARTTVEKYVQSGAMVIRQEFQGDNLDQRIWMQWCAWWLSDVFRVLSDGGVALSFIDWRQLPALTDAIQLSGLVWRGLCTWWKPGVRMMKGRVSNSAEYIAYATKGAHDSDGEESIQNVFSCQPLTGDDKVHIAQKPIEVLKWVSGAVRAGGSVLDPFLGSGTTAIACAQTGRPFIGFEKDGPTFAKAVKRITDELERHRLFEPPAKVIQKSFLEVT